MTKKERRLKIKAIIQNLKQGVPITKTCRAADVPYPTYVFWKTKYPRFERLVTLASISRVQIVEDALYSDAVKGNTTAQIFFLKNRGKDWKDTPLIDASRHTHTTFVKGAIIKAGEIDARGRITIPTNPGDGK